MATRQATVWFLLRRNICSITFLKFAFSISATRTHGKKFCLFLAHYDALWLSRPSRYIKCSLHAKPGPEQISQGFIGLFSVEEGDGWNPPFSSLVILAEGLWQAWGRKFQHLPHFPREKSGGCGTLACRIQPGKRGYKQTQGLLSFVSFV